ncbi:cation diffusion facilitator family transporter [Chloroflexota bacterium]
MFSTKRGVARLSIATVAGLVALKVFVALITGSLSIYAQAIDSFLDLFAVGVTFFAVGFATKPADKEHPFGHGKVEPVAALAQAILIATATGFIVYFAIRRIILGVSIELTEAGIGMMLVSIVVSIFLSRRLRRVARATDSIALESNAQNIAADVYSAGAVLAGLIVVHFTDLRILDPVIALLVALFILKVAYGVLRKSFRELTDSRLAEVEENTIRLTVAEHGDKVVSFHKLRTRRAGSQRHVDLHLVMPRDATVEETHQLCDCLEERIKASLPDSSITIHVEPCSPHCDKCPLSCKHLPDRA